MIARRSQPKLRMPGRNLLLLLLGTCALILALFGTACASLRAACAPLLAPLGAGGTPVERVEIAPAV
jgi:hypothetical protein